MNIIKQEDYILMRIFIFSPPATVDKFISTHYKSKYMITLGFRSINSVFVRPRSGQLSSKPSFSIYLVICYLNFFYNYYILR